MVFGWLNLNQGTEYLLLFFNKYTFLKDCYHLSFLLYSWNISRNFDFEIHLKNLISFFMENLSQKNCLLLVYDWNFLDLKSFAKLIIILL